MSLKSEATPAGGSRVRLKLDNKLKILYLI